MIKYECIFCWLKFGISETILIFEILCLLQLPLLVLELWTVSWTDLQYKLDSHHLELLCRKRTARQLIPQRKSQGLEGRVAETMVLQGPKVHLYYKMFKIGEQRNMYMVLPDIPNHWRAPLRWIAWKLSRKHWHKFHQMQTCWKLEWLMNNWHCLI